MQNNQTVEFVNRLAHDVAFRESLLREPAAVLGQYGFDADLLPGEGGITLPDPEALRQMVSEIELEGHGRMAILIFSV
ncbi:MAG: hypothetical protein H4O13_13735 [Xanthomonadales bacterium]|nr:hypothetical protein [Xanthomonadales bacterium]